MSSFKTPLSFVVIVLLLARSVGAQWTISIPADLSSYSKTATVSGSGIADGNGVPGGEFAFGTFTKDNNNVVTFFNAENTCNVTRISLPMGMYSWETPSTPTAQLAPPQGGWDVSPENPQTHLIERDHAARILATANPTSPDYNIDMQVTN